MNAYLSKKFKILSAISILMVLYIHMYYTEGKVCQSCKSLKEPWDNIVL